MKNKKYMKGGVLLLALLLLLCALPLAAAAEENRPTLIVGGMPFGVRFFTDGILVVGYCNIDHEGTSRNPARDAGLYAGDCIIKVNEETPGTAEEFAKMVQDNGEKPLSVTVRRGAEELTVSLTPLACDADGRFRTGLWVRDSGAGIGTVTYMIDGTHAFAGLGHGICDGECGVLVPISRGSVMGVTIGSVTRGAIGAPGELRGHFSASKTGTLLTNTVCGVYGVFAEAPASPVGALPIAFRNEVKNGEATLWCTLDDNVTRGYTVEISSINRDEHGNKCFAIKVTDNDLLARTGGIVQGMSGSPLVQDGKLIGAVTHVLIGDPTSGYGIFIENMLESMPAELHG